MRKWSKADAINLGDGADTVTLNATAALTTADNADAAVVIKDFGTGDTIKFAGNGLETSFGTLSSSNVQQTTITETLTTKNVYLGDGSNPVADDLAAFKALFNKDGSDNKIKALADDEEVIILTKVSDTSTAMNLWYVKGVTDSGDATADNDIIVLLGTVDNGTMSTLTPADFGVA